MFDILAHLSAAGSFRVNVLSHLAGPVLSVPAPAAYCRRPLDGHRGRIVCGCVHVEAGAAVGARGARAAGCGVRATGLVALADIGGHLPGQLQRRRAGACYWADFLRTYFFCPLLLHIYIRQVDFFNLDHWAEQFTEHCFFLVPLCADLVLPEQYDSPLRFMETKFPLWVAVLSDWCWLLVPLVFLTVGNYNLDSKNTFCFFPGCPYFGRVVTTNIADENTGHSQKSNLSLIRRWAMSRKPPPNTSTHFWFRDLPPPEKAAFHAAANCYQICNMFRSLFNEKHVSTVFVPWWFACVVSVALCDGVLYCEHASTAWRSWRA